MQWKHSLIGALGAVVAMCGATSAQMLPHHIVDTCASPTISSVASGAWNDPATWDNKRAPSTNDVVRIVGGHAVTYAVVSDVPIACLGIDGALTFSTKENTRLTFDTLFVYAGGVLSIGTTAAPVQADKTAELVVVDRPINTTVDPEQWTHGLLGFGRVQMHGAVKSPTFVRLTAERFAGQTTLPIKASVSGWQAGDRLIVPGTEQWNLDDKPWPQEYETPTLRAVNSTVLTTSALQFTHKGARDGDGKLDFLPHVGNLSRNVIIRSANPSGVRGHVLFTGRANVDLRYTLFKDLGRTTIQPLDMTTFSTAGQVTHLGTNQIGRYALHMHHHVGPVTTPANGYQFTLVGNAIDGALKWGITVHNAHYGLIADNVVYNAAGSGIVTEDGSESFNVFERNFVVRSFGTGDERGDLRNIWLDIAWEGSAFWFRNNNNWVRDNVAANTNSFAYAFYSLDMQSARVPKFKGADTSIAGQFDVVNMQKVPVREFARNEVYASADGLTIWDWMADCCAVVNEGPESVVKDFTAWHLGRYGYYGYGHNRLTFDGWKQRGDPSLLWSGYIFNLGIWFGDYPTRNQVIRNFDIQGLRVGIVVPHKPGDTSDIYGKAPGVTRIEHGNLRVQYGIVAKPMYAVTGGGDSLPPRRVEVDDVTWQPMSVPVAGDTQVGLAMSFQPDTRNANLIQRDEFIVTRWQKKITDNFRLFYTSQAPSAIVPKSTTGILGAPVENKTNAELWASSGIAIGGAVATCATTRKDVEGFACGSSDNQVIETITNLQARFSQGQVFLTWNEVSTAGLSYQVYRSTSPITNLTGLTPIANVAQDSGLNRYTGTRFVVQDLAAPLASGVGLFVWTAKQTASAYYAVTTSEDNTIIAGVNATTAPVSEQVWANPGAVLMSIDTSPGFPVRKYFAWEDYTTWNASWGYYGHRFNVSVKGPLVAGTLYPLVLDLHGAGVNTYEEPPAWVDIPALGIYLFPVARTFTQGNTDPYSGNQALPNHFGQPAGSQVVGFNEARYLRYIAWIKADPFFQIDPTRIYAKGGSMGGGGALRIALRNPTVFAAAASSISYGSPGEWGDWSGFTGKSVGAVLWDNWENATWLINNTNATTPIVHTYRKDDNIIPQTGKPSLLAATEAKHLPYIARWQNGGHNVFWLTGNADFLRFKLNEAYPAFSAASSSDNATTVQEGQRNAQLDWSSSLHSLGAGTAISDTSSSFAMSFTSLSSDQTATVTFRNTQAFHPTSGQNVTWSNVANSTTIQSGNVTADAQGLVTITGVQVKAAGNRVTLTTSPGVPSAPAAPTNAVLIGGEGGGSMPYSNGYTYRRSITVDDTKVSGSGDLTSFPMLVSGTYAYLATVANGGKVEHGSGFDIRFETSGGTKLDHEVERWVSTSGLFIAWVRIPTLDGDAPTVVYMYYGNASVSATEENAASVWDSNYVSVVHMHNAAEPITDSKAGNNGSTNGAGLTVQATGKVGFGIDFAAADTNFLNFGDLTILDEATAYTSQVWVKFDTLGTGRRLIGKWGGELSWLVAENDSNSDEITGAVQGPSSTLEVWETTAANLTTATWYLIHVMWSAAGGGRILKNGASQSISTVFDTSPPSIFNSNAQMRFGAQADITVSLDGILDEVRLSNIVRSDDWALTEFNNQNDPATFYAVGSEETAGVAMFPPFPRRVRWLARKER
jgi:dienelactone hydrolase